MGRWDGEEDKEEEGEGNVKMENELKPRWMGFEF